MVIWFVVCWINLPHNHVNVFHLTWIMLLHYLVKLEMLIAHVVRERNSKIYPTSAVASKFTSWLQRAGNCKRKCTKHASSWSLIYTNWNSDWERPAGLRRRFAAPIRQWRRRLSECVKTGGGNCDHHLWLSSLHWVTLLLQMLTTWTLLRANCRLKRCLHVRTCIAYMYDIHVYAIHAAIYMCVPVLRTGIAYTCMRYKYAILVRTCFLSYCPFWRCNNDLFSMWGKV